MASIIKIKRSETTGQIPGSLELGEIAVNLFDRKLYVGNSTGISAIGGEDFRIATQASDEGAYIKLNGDTTQSSNSVLLEAGTDLDITHQANGSILFGLEATIASNTTGTAATADAMTSAVTVTLTGDTTGTATFTNAGDTASITTTIADASIEGAQIAPNSLGANTFVAKSVGTAAIADGAITGAQVAATSLGANTLASDSVTTVKIVDANVTEAKLASDSVSTAKIVDANVTEAKLASDSVSTAKIVDANVTDAKLATDAVVTSKIAAGAVTNAKIAADAVTLGTQTTGNYVSTVADAGAGDIVVTGSGSETATVTLDLADEISSNTSGTAAQADAMSSAVTVTLTGDVAGTATFTNAGDTASITATIQADSVALGTDTTGDYVEAIQGTAGEIEVSAGGEGATVTIGLPDDVTIGGQLNVTENAVITGNTSVGGDLSVSGDLNVTGAVTYLSSSTVNVDDSMLKLSANNVADVTDHGVYAQYVEGGTTKWAGYFRDASDSSIFKFYTDVEAEPTTTVDTTATGYTQATIEATIDGGSY